MAGAEIGGITFIEDSFERQSRAAQAVGSLALPGETYPDIQKRVDGQFDTIEGIFENTGYVYDKSKPGDFFFQEANGRLYPIPTVIDVKVGKDDDRHLEQYDLWESGALVERCGVSIHPGTKLAARTVIRAYVSIGEAVSIGSETTVGSGAKIGDGATIGNKCDIGSGAQIGKRATLGRGVEVDYKAVVLNKQKIKNGSTVVTQPSSVINTHTKHLSLWRKLAGRTKATTPR